MGDAGGHLSAFVRPIIGIAAADLGAPLEALTAQFPGVKYLFFGFGDRHFLMAKHQNLPALLGALWPGPGMMLRRIPYTGRLNISS
jgi:hypothetical protein